MSENHKTQIGNDKLSHRIWRRTVIGVMRCDKCIIGGDRIEVRGDGNTVRGNGCMVIGHLNRVIGNDCFVGGDENTVDGDSCTINGDCNFVNGYYCTIVGDCNIVKGCGAKISGVDNDIRGAPDCEYFVANGECNSLETKGLSVTDVKIRPPRQTEFVDQKADVESERCVICMDNKKFMMISECRHLCFCYGCANKFTESPHRFCPICRTAVVERLERVITV